MSNLFTNLHRWLHWQDMLMAFLNDSYTKAVSCILTT
jgi:hypothetical protein